MVPTQLFKAVYDPKRNQAAAYLVDNVDNAVPRVISIAELTTVSGIDVFPAVSKEVKAVAMSLPEPKSHQQWHHKRGN